MSLEVKLRFDSADDRKAVVDAMCEYSRLVKYGIKCLKPNSDNKKQVYHVLTGKFASTPARTVSIAVEEDIAAMINSYAGLQAKDFPLTLRLDKDNSEFFVDDSDVKVKMAVYRLKKGELAWVTAKVMPKRCLAYKYYRNLFSSSKGYRLPFKLVMRNGQIYAKITVDKSELVAASSKPHVDVGIDLNAYWVGKVVGHPLAIAFVKDDGSFARQPLLMKEWAEIPSIIRQNQQLGKNKVKKAVTNQFGIIIKKLLELTKDYDATFKLEDLKGLNKVKGAYSKFFYRKFAEMLENKSLQVVKVDPKYTSQTCSKCGKTGKAEKRTFYCETCYPKGFHRDINAAINIAKR